MVSGRGSPCLALLCWHGLQEARQRGRLHASPVRFPVQAHCVSLSQLASLLV
nr:unnamed protein product [Digitaria exilis]